MNNKENILAKWMIGNAKDAELKSISTSSDDFKAYIKLKEVLQNFKSPEPDLNLTYNQLVNKRSEVKSLNDNNRFTYYMWFSLAASIIVFFAVGIYHFGLVGKEVYTAYASEKKIYFGDNVTAKLFENTTITQNAPLYNTNNVHLDKGKAYFEVVKGNNFTIKTFFGKVSVLGTKFSVEVKNNFLEVICYEGKVVVLFEEKKYYVVEGTIFNSKDREVNKINVDDSNKSVESSKYKSFNSVKLNEVIDFIEKKYNVSIDIPKQFINLSFSGTFPLNNLEEALGLISSSIDLKYEVIENRVYFKK